MRSSAQVLRFLLLPLGVAMTLSCGSSEDNSTTPQTVATPIAQAATPPAAPPVADAATVESEVTASVTIASVQLDSDCKGPSSTKPPSAAKVTGKSSKRARSSSGFKQPCRQSVVQLAFIGHPDKAVMVELRTIRLMDSNGQEVAQLQSREPSQWLSEGYRAWDQSLAAKGDLKTSYKLSAPNWADVDKAIGSSSFGHMFTLEVGVAIDGVMHTVESPQFGRSRAQMIRT